MTENFTFRQEVLNQYDVNTYEIFMEVFDSMPLACVIDDKYIAMHGGLSPELTDQKIDEINKIERFKEIPFNMYHKSEGGPLTKTEKNEKVFDDMMCDLLWADPMKDDEAIKGKFSPNTLRDCSITFGRKPTKSFLENNQLVSIVRAHQVFIEGFKMHKWDGPQSFPYVITVFSAPNYCGYYDNKAAVIIMADGNISLKQFEETEPPYRLPDNMDVFTWSVPFLAQKVMSMLFSVVKKVGEADSEMDVIDYNQNKVNSQILLEQ